MSRLFTSNQKMWFEVKKTHY